MRIIGHRGARGEAPENTLGGFQYIQEIGIRRTPWHPSAERRKGFLGLLDPGRLVQRIARRQATAAVQGRHIALESLWTHLPILGRH